MRKAWNGLEPREPQFRSAKPQLTYRHMSKERILTVSHRTTGQLVTQHYGENN